MSKTTRQGKVYTSKDMDDIRQPLNKKTGYTDERFDELYGKDKNPWIGTERDVRKRKKYF